MRVAVVLALLTVTACSEEQVQGTLVGGANGSGSGDMFGGISDGAGPSDAPAGQPDANPRTTTDLAGWQEPDAPPNPGAFLAPCLNHGDCDSGVCIEGPNGPFCTKTCSGGCSSNWFKCNKWVSPNGDDTFICVPRFKSLCFPCMEHKECNGEGESGNLCLPYKGQGEHLGSFCGVKCDPLNPVCPPGYGCIPVTDEQTGLKSSQCMRQGAAGQGLAQCECAAKAIEQGLKTQCSVTGIVYDEKATCIGTRYCKADGLTVCSAHVPDIELCDGKDNDCNGKTDDFQEKNVPCFSKPNDFGKCKGVLIDCVDGVAKCSAVPAQPEKCNGIDDNCDGVTDEGLCEDGDPCTKDVCNTDGSCKHAPVPAGDPCDDGSVCTTVDKCIAGKCIGGKEKDCDDQDPCTTDVCNPIDGCLNKPASDAVCKDDGNPCTLDQCQTGKCVHPPASGKPCTDDGEACTQDVCEQGVCDHPPAKQGTPCLDDGKPCTQDVCQSGKCAHPNGDGLPCLDDGKACTADICQGGGCAHPPNTEPCEDGNYCTDGDKCSGGGCKPGNPKNCNDNNPCTNDACNTKSGCVHTDNNFASCIAPNGECPSGQCSGGQCLSKPNVTCKTKVKVSLCDKVEVTGSCTAAGQCVPTKKYDPASCTVPCKSFCATCFGINVCLDFLFGI